MTDRDKVAHQALSDAVAALLRGDFSASEPLSTVGPGTHDRPAILDWLERGWFDAEPAALDEPLALTSAATRRWSAPGAKIRSPRGTGASSRAWDAT